MDRMLSSALISATKGAGVELKKVRNGDTYQKLRELRRELLSAARRADSQIAEFGDDRSVSNKRIVICPVDSEVNFKHGYLGAYTVMVGYFENGTPTFSTIYLPQDDVMINATKGAGTQVDGSRITAPSGATIKTQLIGGIFDSFITHDARAEANITLIGSRMMEIVMRETGGFRASGSLGTDVLLCLRGQLGGLVSPYLEPERRTVFLALSEAGLRVSDFEGGLISSRTTSLIAGPKEVHQELVKMAKRASI